MDDFLKQLRTLRRMGLDEAAPRHAPGCRFGMLKDFDFDDKQLDRIEGIVHSMTPDERDEIKLLSRKSRVKRIAKGAGSQPADVNRLVKQFEMIQKMTKQMSGAGGFKGKMAAMRELSAAGAGAVPGLSGMPSLGGRGSTKTQSPKRGFKQRKKRK